MSKRRRDATQQGESSDSRNTSPDPSGEAGPVGDASGRRGRDEPDPPDEFAADRSRSEPTPHEQPGDVDDAWQLDEDGNPIFVVAIEEAIDLHSFQPREVLGVVDAYLDAAIERGFREVRLIHGRGKGVQRANVQRSLETDARVERYADAPHHRGGWGATLVWLRPAAPASADD